MSHPSYHGEDDELVYRKGRQGSRGAENSSINTRMKQRVEPSVSSSLSLTR